VYLTFLADRAGEYLGGNSAAGDFYPASAAWTFNYNASIWHSLTLLSDRTPFLLYLPLDDDTLAC
jgi:hypothetical protein